MLRFRPAFFLVLSLTACGASDPASPGTTTETDTGAVDDTGTTEEDTGATEEDTGTATDTDGRVCASAVQTYRITS